MAYSIRIHSVKCVEESDEVSLDDEPYVLVTTIDLTPPPPPPVPTPIPLPTPVPGRPVMTRVYGEWKNFDKDEILDLVGERPFWGTFTEPWEPADIGNPDNVCFVVTVMEHDHGNIQAYRGGVQAAATTSLLSSFMLARPARVTQLLADVRSAIDLFGFPTLDNHVGTQELRLDSTDLAIPVGSHKDKKLFFDGGSEGKWELVFRIVHHERRVFPGGRLAAVSRRWDTMELWTVGLNNQLFGNGFLGRWHGWYALPGRTFDVGTYLAAVSRGPDQMEVWGVGQDGTVHGVWFDGSWRPWYSLPGAEFPSGAPLAAVSRYKDHMEVWGVDVHGKVRGTHFADGWKPWYTLEGETFPATAHLVAVSRSAFDMQLWVVADDKPVFSNRWIAGAGWGGWRPLGSAVFPPATHLAAVVRKEKLVPPPPPPQWGFAPEPTEPVYHVHVFAVDMAGIVQDYWYKGELERDWHVVPGETFNAGSPMAAVSREPESIDVWAVRATDDVLCFDQGVGLGWTGWNAIDTETTDPPGHMAALSPVDGRLNVWAIRNGGVSGNVLLNGTWQGWYSLGWSFVA